LSISTFILKDRQGMWTSTSTSAAFGSITYSDELGILAAAFFDQLVNSEEQVFVIANLV
jgi:hypothetical protein